MLTVLRNDEQVDSGKTWEDLHEITKSEMRRTKRTLYIVIVMFKD